MIWAIWMLGLTYTRNWPKKVNSVSTLPKAHGSDLSASPWIGRAGELLIDMQTTN